MFTNVSMLFINLSGTQYFSASGDDNFKCNLNSNYFRDQHGLCVSFRGFTEHVTQSSRILSRLAPGTTTVYYIVSYSALTQRLSEIP